MIAEPEDGRLEEIGIDQRRLALALAPPEPPRERPEPDRAGCEQRADRFAALLPDENAEHDSAHAEDGQDGADDVDLARARVRRVLHEPDPREHDQDHEVLAQERDPPGEVRRDEPSDERPDRGGDRSGGADQRVGLLLHRAGEVAVDQRLHGRKQERRPEAADDRPEDDDREQVLCQRHRQRADRIPEQPEHVRALAPDQVADLAPDQDERRRDERLERDRRLDAADGRVQVARRRPRWTRSSATCPPRARTSPSPGARRAASSPSTPRRRPELRSRPLPSAAS